MIMKNLIQTNYFLVIFLLLCLSLTIQGCGLFDNDEPYIPTTANPAVNVRFPCYGSGPIAERRIIYEFTPIDLKGTKGKDLSFTLDVLRDSRPTCIDHSTYLQHAGALAAGVWKIKVSYLNWSAECEVHLTNGNNIINFTRGKLGCSTGFTFP